MSVPTPHTTPPFTSPLDLAPVLPVVVIREVELAVPLARALLAGGLPAIEVTLRSPAALEACRRICAEVPEAVVGVGTVRTPAQVGEAHAAGARFLVSPGTTPNLLAEMVQCGLPFLPGTATVSEMMSVAERGITEMKLFPADAVGGVALLDAVRGPLPGLRFCPTGGIRAHTAHRYLALPNVGCVGGTWLTPDDMLREREWGRITELAAAAAALDRGRDDPDDAT
ncbi:bifunctional 4-hydroxy-2-oxoglutarate aldolase/2-dehydro-3-deoxy-phosphogluconate aldolase [Pseudonocardia oroxyli]|uniref:2-dehydro-3-deoxy-phosphogluconate aldolase n=1 Tax=Pseudonocardia oroxyli TaxID=366584 RepID=A0A1G7SUU3_PSEOR|nr:bifunctional 4-hydroxy-2-oxoglutarate aldolase/2-dehydro-3-deoxy-phosphogluconate aldolase [Pseudonocardia oroxyli]SDG26837.1 2-dehydro-3-deoxyphosphogluconate aldolase / (4S)-4-hydroxy-2-oxoglutarate aldolase [Pseudonocardia oroxyli]